MTIPDSFREDALHLNNYQLGEKYNRHPDTMIKWKRRLNQKVEPDQPGSGNGPEIITIKPQIYRPREKVGSGRKQVQALLLSDTHAGAITATYSPEAFKSRLETLFNSVVGIRALQAKQHPVEDLVIFGVGDFLQGENVGIQMSLDEYSMSVYNQVYKLWLPALTEFLINLLQHYRTITWYGVKGNHGASRDRKMSSRDHNWDTVAQQALSMATAGYKDIVFHIEPVSFYQIAEVLGWRFMLLHGDVIKMSYSTPYYGIDRRTGDWEVLFHPDVFCCGHFHSPGRIRPRTTPIIMNGTFKSDDEWAIGAIGKSGPPAQVTFGIHPERPVSWWYELELT